MNITIRKAVAEDSPILAELMNIAGDGIPAYLWAGMVEPGENVMAFGARRVARTEGGFSYRNVHVAVSAGAIVGMLLGYRLPDTPDTDFPDDCPPLIRTLLELEALAPGSWYINAVAAVAEYRGQGIGSRLMLLAESLAVESAATTTSLIVAEENLPARKLYEKLGYTITARRPIVPYPACPHSGDWVLMKKSIG